MVAELRERIGRELERVTRDLEVLTSSSRAEVVPRATASPDRRLARRMRLLQQLLGGMANVDPITIYPDRAGFGSQVRVRDLSSGREENYVLMTVDVMEMDEGQVSLGSPIGHALLGHRTGDVVTVVTPRGERRFQIVHLTTLHHMLDGEARVEHGVATKAMPPA